MLLPQRLHDLVLLPVAEAAIRFKLDLLLKPGVPLLERFLGGGGSLLPARRTEGQRASPPSQYRFTQSYLGAVADLVFDCRGPIAHFAPQKDLDRLELEFLRIAPVLPRPAYRLAPLVDSPPQSFTVNFEGPNSCRSTVMPVPSLHLSPKRRPSASAIWLRQEL